MWLWPLCGLSLLTENEALSRKIWLAWSWEGLGPASAAHAGHSSQKSRPALSGGGRGRGQVCRSVGEEAQSILGGGLHGEHATATQPANDGSAIFVAHLQVSGRLGWEFVCHLSAPAQAAWQHDRALLAFSKLMLLGTNPGSTISSAFFDGTQLHSSRARLRPVTARTPGCLGAQLAGAQLPSNPPEMQTSLAGLCGDPSPAGKLSSPPALETLSAQDQAVPSVELFPIPSLRHSLLPGN